VEPGLREAWLALLTRRGVVGTQQCGLGNRLVSADFVHLGDTCFIVTAGGPESSARVNSSPNRTFHIWMIVKCSNSRHRVRPGGAARIARLQGIWFRSIL